MSLLTKGAHMFIEINIEMRETGETYFQGEVKLVNKETGDQREFTFTLSIAEELHLIVRCKERIFINTKALNRIHLTETQMTFLSLIDKGIKKTLPEICIESVRSKNFNETAELFEELDMSFEIVAKDIYDLNITDPVDQSKVIQLFDDTN